MATMLTRTDGHFFEDFALGQVFEHRPVRTITAGDISLNLALTGSRFAESPAGWVDDILVFNLVFSQSVADISKNAVANLGYAELRFGVPVALNDTLSSRSEVIGLRQTSSGDSGVVYVRTCGQNQRGETVLEFVRWVLVKKQDLTRPAPPPVVPKLAASVFCAPSTTARHSYQPGQKFDHGDGALITEAAHQLATRFYQNPARLHFDPSASSTGKCLVYGGYIISLARAAMVNGLAVATRVRALHSGKHINPVFAGDVIYAASEILEIPAPSLLRVRLLAAKHKFTDWPGATDPALVLDLDLTLECHA